MKCQSMIKQNVLPMVTTLVLLTGVYAKSGATTYACFFRSTGCEARAGSPCGSNPLFNKFEIENTNDWICNGRKASFVTACKTEDTGECCMFVSTATACPSTNLCPCPYTQGPGY